MTLLNGRHDNSGQENTGTEEAEHLGNGRGCAQNQTVLALALKQQFLSSSAELLKSSQSENFSIWGT